MEKLINTVKGHWPALVAFATAVWMQYGSTITAWISAHPKYAGWAGFISFAVGYYMKNPQARLNP